MNHLADQFPMSLTQHIHVEPYSQRIKVYALPSKQDMALFLHALKSLAREQKCDKLIFYVKQHEVGRFADASFQYEGVIKGFFQGKDAIIYALFLQPDRNRTINEEKEQWVKMQSAKGSPKKNHSLPQHYLMRRPTEEDAQAMAALYRDVFQTYPTPMHDPAFIQSVMRKQVYFTVIEYKATIVSACSADVFVPFQSAEMSDCATSVDHRSRGLLSYQFSYLISLMKQKGIWTLFSYSRSLSLGMNIVNARHGFQYGGKMTRNSNISGQLESMNIWYKQLRFAPVTSHHHDHCLIYPINGS